MKGLRLSLQLLGTGPTDRIFNPRKSKKKSKELEFKAKQLGWYGVRYAKEKVNAEYKNWFDSEEMKARNQLLDAIDSDLQGELELRLTGTESERQVRNMVDNWIDDQ